MDYLLQVKVGCLLGLLVLTLFFGLMPIVIPWFRTSATAGRHQSILRFISCFAAGVFLSACLLDIIPDYLSDITEQLEERHINKDYPIAEIILAGGFFLVFLIEQVVLDYKDGHSGENTSLLSSEGGSGALQYNSHNTLTSNHDLGAEELDFHGRHVHVDFNAHSPFRSFVLVISLSLHSVFEGLAIGLQETNYRVLEICIAVLIHKSIIVFSLSIKLIQSNARSPWLVACIVVFAVMSPLGIAVGIGVTQTLTATGKLVRCILEGVAAGTFVYITFLEILPHELDSSDKRLWKLLFIVLGFSVTAGISLIG
ncbi:zinc transporter ZIP1-like [Latimeria chalumnae]|uniref:Solute carrier family 39 member 1 n=1 Tax=Latimeria chalumnae TaxID=7897 RepID=H3AYM7_LATCH|nr:PREDICTED: zinc transporter ZIP1-like [Latimeria chalumnae]|eukprot:XP_005989801.1 PREDICTED: zinc transporter ZIP1-like [Latimeria chalumnae]